MTWRPITEAPRDDSGLTIVNDNGEYAWRSAVWGRDTVRGELREGWWDNGFWIDPQPTHFFDIPPLQP